MMKSLKVSKVLGSLKKKNSSGSNGIGSASASASADPRDGPEAIASRNAKAFCESGGPNSGDEITFLPPIVDAAESSPAAAAECARVIRHYLKKEYFTRPSFQYNAIMLIRILADNPGPTFTRNLDDKFVKTAKEVLKSPDPSVYQMLMETLEAFEANKAYDEGLAPLLAMWKSEKKESYKRNGARGSQQPPQPPQPRTLNAPPYDAHSQNYFARHHTNRRLPEPVELASRLEEARTSATLLHQVVSSTPPGEVLQNELIKEFADRCTSATRSIQGYMSASDPAPDNDTMESLIDVNEQLQASLSLHQRAMLNARKQTEIDAWTADVADAPPPDGPPPPSDSSRPLPRSDDSYSNGTPPALPSRSAKPQSTNGKGKEREYEPATAGPSGSASRSQTPPAAAEDNPFRDPDTVGSGAGAADEPRLAYEPFHPGFGPTASYVGRQDSAVGKEAMHGGGAGSGQAVGSGSGSGAAVTSGASGSGAGANTGARRRDSDSGSDIYDWEAPKQKEPIYRY